MKNKPLDKKYYQEFVENFWLNLGQTHEIKTHNIFAENEIFQENPVMGLVDILRQPKNFGYTCQVLFGIKLHPYQVICLQMLWYHSFPIFIATRGGSKSFLLAIYALLLALFKPGSKIVITGTSFRQAKIIFTNCEQIWKNAPIFKDILYTTDNSNRPTHEMDMFQFRIGRSTIVALPTGDGCLSPYTAITYGNKIANICDEHDEQLIENTIYRNEKIWGNGKFVDSDEAYYNGVRPTKRIVTHMGFEIEGTLNHKLKVLRNKEIQWVKLEDMIIGDRILIDRSSRWFDSNEQITEPEAYALGLMLGDGSLVNKYFLHYTTSDIELLDSLELGTGYKFKPTDKYHYIHRSKEDRIAWLNKWEMKSCYTIDKYLPPKILRSSKLAMSFCLSGIFDTDGNVRVTPDKRGGTALQVCLTNTSKKLIDQIQYILLHYGIVAYKSERDRNEKWNTSYELVISGEDVLKFYNQIGFKLKRKFDELTEGVKNKIRWVSSGDEVPQVKDIIIQMISEKRRKKGTGTVLSNSLSVSKFKNRKIITFRDAKKCLDFLTDRNPILYAKLKEIANPNIYYDEIIDIKDSECDTYDLHVPETHEYCANGFFSHNTRIRGQRSSCLIVDEFNTVDVRIYQEVMQGFGAVAINPIEQVIEKGKRQALLELGTISQEKYWELEAEKDNNQQIISGTPGYTFEHLYTYWKRYHNIIMSQGDPHKLHQIFSGNVPLGLNWKDFAVIRLPYDILPKGYMDDKIISMAQATTSLGIFQSEYGSVFISDSLGFFRRTLIEKCTCGNAISPITKKSCGAVHFNAMLRGQLGGKYVMGIDPASEQDNLAITILEVWPDHRRLVYCWTVNKEKHKAQLRAGVAEEHDYNRFCCRKIRDLMKLFKIEFIGLDSQGGGVPIREVLGDPKHLKSGEYPIYEIVESGVDKDTDNLEGLHILHMIQFANADWTHNANHGLKQDMETQEIIFPVKDSLAFGLAHEEDKIHNRLKINEDGTDSDGLYDTLEDCMLEIEELKNELVLIEHSKTATGRDKWDTPQIKAAGSKKGRLRKDRYSSIIISNMIGRSLISRLPEAEYVIGGLLKDMSERKPTKKSDGVIGFAVHRGNRSSRRF